MELIDESLKNAICNNDLLFLKNNLPNFNINHCFKDEDNDSLLTYAISDPETEAYTFFLENKANTNHINNEGENILHSAIYSGKLDRVKLVINDNNLNKQSNDFTPLLLSLVLGFLDISDYLIEYGANLSYGDNDDSLPIHLASFFGYKNIVIKLIKKGTNLNIKTKKGNLPLALAVNNNHIEVVKILYEATIDKKTAYNKV